MGKMDISNIQSSKHIDLYRYVIEYVIEYLGHIISLRKENQSKEILRDPIRNDQIRRRTKVRDIIEKIAELK